MSTTDNNALLSANVLAKIFQHVDIDTWVVLRKVCTTFRDVIDDMVKENAVQRFAELPPAKLAKFRNVCSAWGEAIDREVLADAEIAERRRQKFGASLDRLHGLLRHCIVENDAKTTERLLEVTEIDVNRFFTDRLLEVTEIDILKSNCKGTLLTLAATKDNPDFVRQLLHRPDIEVDLCDSLGRSPLALAAYAKKSAEVFDMLWQESNPGVEQWKAAWVGATMSDFKHAIDRLKAIPEVVAQDFVKDMTPALHGAIRRKQNQKVRNLLDGNDVNVNAIPTPFGRVTALMLAIDVGNEEAAEWLLERDDVDVNALVTGEGSGYCALTAAMGNPRLLLLLLERPDIDLNVRGPKEATPLIVAVQRNCKEAVSALVADARADVNAVDDEGKSAFELAFPRQMFGAAREAFKRAEDLQLIRKAFFGSVFKPELAEILLERRGDLDSRDERRMMLEEWRQIRLQFGEGEEGQ